MNIIQVEDGKIIKSWCKEIEASALSQIQNLARLPFAFHHVALMPDCHTGYGMPIGGVLATERVVIPNAVGVDIGCGMCAVKTSLKVEQFTPDALKRIMGEIRKVIPVGMNRHQHAQDRSLMPIDEAYAPLILKQEYGSALKSLGTLGGGNHFIEIQKDTEGSVWIMIHSGSRNLGKKVADHYNALAVEMNEKYFSVVPKNWELAFLPLNTQEAKDYITEMNFCVSFALANRTLMMDRILDVISSQCESQNCGEESRINIAHNYARIEHHFGKDVMVHRKGATSARGDEFGIIPGSQGSKSYIVRGLGNEESFQSCSHGAGRKMGRKQASRELNLQDEIRKLDEQGIIHSIRTEKDLDEASGAYKDVAEVMKSQQDLVEIITELSPLAVIKG